MKPRKLTEKLKGLLQCKELLSSRLQGGAIKEALAIHLLLKFRAEFPTSTVPEWFPPGLISAKHEALSERLAFLTALSFKPNATERSLKAKLTCKRKLVLTPTEKQADSGLPCKRQRVFTNTPSEFVKICSAYMQAQAALLEKPQLTEKVVEKVLIRLE